MINFIKIITIFTILVTNCFADRKHYKIFMKNKMYFSAYESIISDDFKSMNEKEISNLLTLIDPTIFLLDNRIDRFASTKGLEYAHAIRAFNVKNYGLALDYLNRISNKKLQSYIYFIKGEIYYAQKNYPYANSNFSKCVQEAKKHNSSSKQVQYFYTTLSGQCMQNIGRIFFEQGDHEKSLKYLKKIEQENYVWPLTLIDTAWSHYWLKDYNRSLGTLLSYKIDILSKFYEPDVTYLRALNYYDLCYYARAEEIVNDFEKNVWKNFSLLLDLLKSNARNDFNILEKQLNRKEFIYYKAYMSQLKNSYKMKKFEMYQDRIDRELKILTKLSKSKYYRDLHSQIGNYKKAIEISRGNFLKMKVYEYASNLKNTQKRLTKLKLNINLQKRKLVRTANTSTFDSDVLKKSIGNIKNSDSKYVWEFKGGFWIDEMGDYAVAISNKCN